MKILKNHYVSGFYDHLSRLRESNVDSWSNEYIGFRIKKKCDNSTSIDIVALPKLNIIYVVEAVKADNNQVYTMLYITTPPLKNIQIIEHRTVDNALNSSQKTEKNLSRTIEFE